MGTVELSNGQKYLVTKDTFRRVKGVSYDWYTKLDHNASINFKLVYSDISILI